MFKQKYYHNGKIAFPDFCNQELAFEWNFKTDEINFHFFEYKDNSALEYSHTEGLDSSTMERYTPFRNLSNDEYKQWYKKNHYHKRKGLPIYYWEDSEMMILIKNRINKLRDALLLQLLNILPK